MNTFLNKVDGWFDLDGIQAGCSSLPDEELIKIERLGALYLSKGKYYYMVITILEVG
jgi:hypothetical protein